MSATTPRRTGSLSTSNNPSNSSPRRALADLTPKAINSPSKQRLALEQTESTRAHSPLKQVQSMSPHMLTDKENTLRTGSMQAGRKRTIYEVEDVETAGNATRSYEAREIGWERRRGPITAANLGSLPDHDHFFTQPQTPTEPNTPSPEPEPEVVNNSQTSNQSFSELVNYEFCASQSSSQQPLAPIPEANTKTKVGNKSPKVEDRPPKVEPKPSKADILRATFGMGMYKLRTNQVAKSSHEVISDWEVTSSMTLNTLASSANSSYQSVPNITLSPVRRGQAAHSHVQPDSTRPIPKLFGGPVLLPTSYSSRMIHEYHMPSSPPQAISPQELISPEQAELQLQDHTTPTSKRFQGGEDYSDHEGGRSDGKQRLQRQEERRAAGQSDPISRTGKGEAVTQLASLGETLR